MCSTHERNQAAVATFRGYKQISLNAQRVMQKPWFWCALVVLKELRDVLFCLIDRTDRFCGNRGCIRCSLSRAHYGEAKVAQEALYLSV